MSYQEKENVSAQELLQLVSFRLGDEEFGVDILKVQEIIRLMEITKVPRAPHFVEGIVNLRDNVIPIISLRKRFGLDEKELDKDSRIVVIELGGRIVGFIVDSVDEVLRMSSQLIEPPPDLVAGLEKEYLSGVAKLEDRLLIFLDMERVLSEDEKTALKEAA